MVFWLFVILAFLAFCGFFYHSQTNQTARTLYSAVLTVFWALLAYYFYPMA